MELEKYLSPDLLCLNIKEANKDRVIADMVRLLCGVHRMDSAQEILKTVFAREQDRSTGIGNGVAIPHARTDLVKNIFLSFGRSRTGVEWGSMDGKPAHFIFLVVGPAKASEEYLRVLADISRLMTRASVRNALLELPSPADVLRIMSETKSRKKRI